MKHLSQFSLLLIFISILGASQALQITSTSQLISGPDADGVVGDYLLANDSVEFVITDIPHAVSNANTGGQCIDAALLGGLDDFDLFYLYLNNQYPRQGNYSSLQIISAGTPDDSAHIRVSGVDSYNSNIGIITDYILYDGTTSLKAVTSFTNNSAETLNDYGIGDAFAWGSIPFVPGNNSMCDWLASTTENTVYGYYYSESFAAVHGSYWSDATLENVNIYPNGSVDMTRYLTVGNSLQDIYSTYMSANNITPGAISGSVFVDGMLKSDVTVNFTKELDAGPTLTLKTDDEGKYSVQLEPGNWICKAINLLQTEEQNVTVAENSDLAMDFNLGNSGTDPVSYQDTISIIQRPLMNIPTMVLPGDTFQIEIDLAAEESPQSVSLVHEKLEYPLDFTEISQPSPFGLRTLEAYVPDPILFELYDLKINFSGEDSLDISENSIYVIPEYQDTFTFIQVTDTHLPSHFFWGDAGLETDSTELIDFREVIDDINIIHPDFVLHTGDLINDGEIEVLGVPSISRAKNILKEFEVPLYLVAGNHDLGGWDATPAPDGTARRTWWKYFGWNYLNSTDPSATTTQDYSFNYGNTHFIGLEAYNNYDRWRESLYGEDSFIASQLQWFNNDLTVNSDADLTIAFYHKDFQYQLDLSSLGIDAAFWGHVHANNEDNTLPYNISTGSTCDGNRWYRIVKVMNNEIVFTKAVQAGSSGENLTRTTNSDGTMVRITNGYDFDLDNCLVKFPLSEGLEFTSLANASLYQIDSLSDPKIVYALVNVPANSYVDASIQTDSIGSAADPLLPNDHFLMNAYPNPFNPNLTIRYELATDSELNIGIYDVQGRLIRILHQSKINAGSYELTWNAADHPSGLYIIRADIKNASGSFQSVEKCLLMK